MNYLNKMLKKRSRFAAVLFAIFRGEISAFNTINANSKNNLSLSRRSLTARFSGGASKLLQYVLQAIGVFFCVLYAGMAGYSMGSSGAFSNYMLTLTVAKAMFMINMVFNFINVPYYLFLTNDVKYLLGLPIKGTDLIKAKFLQVAYSTVTFDFILFLPMMFAHAYASAAPWHYYLMHFIFVFLAAFASKALLCIIVFMMMSFTAFFKDKDKFMSFASAMVLMVAIVIGVGLQALVRMDAGILAKLFSFGSASLPLMILENILHIFCVPVYFAKWLYGDNMLIAAAALVACIVVTALFLGALYYLAKYRYLDLVMNNQSSAAKARVLSTSELNNKLKHRNAFVAFRDVDSALVSRTPQINMMFKLSPLVMPFYFLAIFLVVGLVNIMSGSFNFSELFNLFTQTLDAVRAYLDANMRWDSLEFLAVTAAAMATLLLFGMSSTCSGEFLRDGISFKFYQALPLKMSTIILVKWRRSFLYNYGIYALIFVAVLLVLRLNPLTSLLFMFSILLLFTLATSTGLIVGAFISDFSLNDEMEIIKKQKGLTRLLLSICLFAFIIVIPYLLITFKYGPFLGFDHPEFGKWTEHSWLLLYILIYFVLINIISMYALLRPVAKYLERKA